MNLDRAAFFLLHTQFFAMVPENRANKTPHSLATNDTAFSRKRGGFFVAGWGLCYAAPHPAKGFASGLQSAFGAALLTLAKRQKTGQKKQWEARKFSVWTSYENRYEVRHTPPSQKISEGSTSYQTGQYLC
ncbi:hypothetical protein [Desulfovibrio sp. SGI.169]|uniref:hypothetical protein n=1 Tax=Desulfovibrio sp. SGI.169 TaxID=3420561 RepID=UPI003D022693